MSTMFVDAPRASRDNSRKKRPPEPRQVKIARATCPARQLAKMASAGRHRCRPVRSASSGYWTINSLATAKQGIVSAFLNRASPASPQIGYIIPLSKDYQGYLNIKG